jgi:mono/diheme cytochrome c family protein
MAHRRIGRVGAVAAVAVIAAVGLGIGWTSWRATGNGATGRADPGDAALVAHGRTVYMAHCAACHGPDLEGQPNWQSRRPDGRLPAPPHDASGHTWHHPDRVLFNVVMDGVEKHAPPGYRSDMPAYRGTLAERDVWAVLAYIKAQWPPEILQKQEQMDRMSRGS